MRQATTRSSPYWDFLELPASESVGCKYLQSQQELCNMHDKKVLPIKNIQCNFDYLPLCASVPCHPAAPSLSPGIVIETVLKDSCLLICTLLPLCQMASHSLLQNSVQDTSSLHLITDCVSAGGVSTILQPQKAFFDPLTILLI